MGSFTDLRICSGSLSVGLAHTHTVLAEPGQVCTVHASVSKHTSYFCLYGSAALYASRVA